MERGVLHNGALRHRRRISHRGLATPPVPQPPTNHGGSRFPSVPGKAVLVFSIAERPFRLIVLRSRCTTGCTPLGPVPEPAQTGFKPEVSCLARLIPAPKQHLPSGHSRPAHPPRALALSPDRQSPSYPCGRITPPRLLFHNTSYGCQSHTVQLQPLLRGHLPEGCALHGGCRSIVPTNDGQACSA